MTAVEDIDDLVLYDAAKAADDGVRIPGEVVHAILEGTHSARAWRSYRGLTLQALADIVGISKAFLSQIETGKRVGSIKVLSALSRALNVPVDLLMD